MRSRGFSQADFSRLFLGILKNAFVNCWYSGAYWFKGFQTYPRLIGDCDFIDGVAAPSRYINFLSCFKPILG